MWAIATWMKWVPAPLWLVLPPKARGWGLVFLLISMLLSLAMLPLTIVQMQALFGFGERPFRADYLVFIWSAVPWWWRLNDPFAFLRLSAWRDAIRRLAGGVASWWAGFRGAPGDAAPGDPPRGPPLRPPLRGHRRRRLGRLHAAPGGFDDGPEQHRGDEEQHDPDEECRAGTRRIASMRSTRRPGRSRRSRRRTGVPSPSRRCSCPCTGPRTRGG